MLVTFDGWSSDYDYWADIDTPDIHPIGYSDQHGIKLQPPRGFKNFSWPEYLQNNAFIPAPFDFFTSMQKGNSSRIGYMNLISSRPGDVDKMWQIGMKLEAKDRQYPDFIAVATVSDIKFKGSCLLVIRDNTLFFSFEKILLSSITLFQYIL